LRKLKTLKLKKTTADVVEVDWVKLSTLNLAKEVIEGIIATLASFKVVGGLRGSAVVSRWAIAWVGASLRMRLIILIRMMLTSVVGRARHGRCIVVGRDLTRQRMTIIGSVVVCARRHAILRLTLSTIGLQVWRAHDDAVISMCLDVLLEILGTLESLATELALVRLQGHMDSDVGGNMIALDCGGTALTPCAGEIEVISRLATNMAFTNMFIEGFW